MLQIHTAKNDLSIAARLDSLCAKQREPGRHVHTAPPACRAVASDNFCLIKSRWSSGINMNHTTQVTASDVPVSRSCLVKAAYRLSWTTSRLSLPAHRHPSSSPDGLDSHISIILCQLHGSLTPVPPTCKHSVVSPCHHRSTPICLCF